MTTLHTILDHVIDLEKILYVTPVKQKERTYYGFKIFFPTEHLVVSGEEKDVRTMYADLLYVWKRCP